MKLTEKELNEFPIGTLIEFKDIVVVKVRRKSFYSTVGGCYYYPCELESKSINKVNIPTYTEYIPPKPILDEKEKEWFNFVRPFRNRVIGIFKSKYCGDEYIRIIIKDDKTLCFPSFKTGTMYKGMELDREYSLEELGL